MISGELFDLYYSNNTVKKNTIITILEDDAEITNTDIYVENVEISETLSGDAQLMFGACNTSTLKFKIANNFSNLKSKTLSVRQVLNSNPDYTMQLGIYRVDSDAPSGNRNYRDIVAYDYMYDIINADSQEIASWYNNLDFPLTLKDFRDSFFDFIGVEQETISLLHDNLSISKTVNTTSITGKTIITSICELSMTFGHIENGVFRYISLGTDAVEIKNSLVIDSGNYEDWLTGKITKVTIKDNSNDTGVSYGENGNTYTVTNNLFLYDREDRETIAQAMLNAIKDITYTPFSNVIKGNPCVQLGDKVRIKLRNATITTYILSRKLTGVQRLSDSFVANGVKKYGSTGNSIRDELARNTQLVTKLQDDSVKNKWVIYSFTNGEEIDIDDRKKERIISIAYGTLGDKTIISFSAEIVLKIECTDDEDSGIYDTVLTVTYTNNNEDFSFVPKETYLDGQHILHLILKFEVEANTLGTFDVSLTANGGNVNILMGDCKAWLEGTGLVAEEQWDGILRLTDTWSAVELPEDISSQGYTEQMGCRDYMPVGGRITELIPDIQLPDDIGIDSYADEIIDYIGIRYDSSNLIYGDDVTVLDGELVTNYNTAVITTPITDISEISQIRVEDVNATYLVSFDGGTTFMTYDGEDWVESSASSMTKAVIEAITEYPEVVGGVVIQATITPTSSLKAIWII